MEHPVTTVPRPLFGRPGLSALALAAALAACGGGAEDPAREFAAAMHVAQNGSATAAAVQPSINETRRRLSVPTTPSAVDANAALDWAEYKYASLFPKGPLSFDVTYAGTRYTARAYVGSWGTRYLGVTPDGSIYGLGDFTLNSLRSYGVLNDYSVQIVAERCATYPGACSNGQPTVPPNSCPMPVAQALAVGTRLVLSYEITGATPGNFNSNSVVDGPADFEGNTLTRISSTTTINSQVSGSNFSSTANDRSYVSAGPLGYLRYHGSETSTTISGFTRSVKTVFSPPYVDLKYGLSIGQTSTSGISLSSTTTLAPGLPPTVAQVSTATTDTFEATEQITVRGRSYNTCRYRQTNASQDGTRTTSWVIVGKGVLVRSSLEATVEGGAVQVTLTELVSGTLNGAPL